MIETIRSESFNQVKNDLFGDDQETDRLADLRQYVDVFDKYEEEVNLIVSKYQQQEEALD